MCGWLILLNYVVFTYVVSIPFSKWMYKQHDVPIEIAVAAVVVAPVMVPVILGILGGDRLFKYLQKIIEQ